LNNQKSHLVFDSMNSDIKKIPWEKPRIYADLLGPAVRAGKQAHHWQETTTTILALRFRSGPHWVS
jgi:hypothetical protein